MNDLRFALRQLAKSPGFTIVAVLTAALGIGACSAIFTVVNSVLLRPIAHPESDRLVTLFAETGGSPSQRTAMGAADFVDCAREADQFESIAAQGRTPTPMTGSGEPVNVLVSRVKGPFFELLRTRPALGRLFGTEAEVPGRNRVVVLTHGYWRRQFGARADIVGEMIKLEGEPHTIIGVLPATFPTDGDEVFAPAVFPEQMWKTRTPVPLVVIGRLKPGVTLAQARAQLETIARRLAEQYPATNQHRVLRALPLLETQTENVQATFYTLLAAVGVLLLIACTNIAHLLLVRATARRRELSVRAALGASRAQIFRQLLIESLVLAGFGGGLGLLVGQWGLDGLLALAPGDLPRAQEIALDQWSVGFTAGLALLTGIGFGLAPAWHSSRLNLVEALKGTTRTAGEHAGRRLLRQGLVAAEIALALMLLTGAGLLIRSFARLTQADPGFKPEGAIVNQVTLPVKKYNTPAKRGAFIEAVMARYRALPGVTAVSASFGAPFSGIYWTTAFQVEGRPVPVSERPQTVHFPITPDYFRTLGIPLLRGRAFNERDLGATRVAIVSQSFAGRFFPGQDAIGQRINLTNDPQNACEIVGIAGDVRHRDFETALMPQSYEPFAQRPFTAVTFAVRAEGDVAALAPALRRELYAVDADQPVFRLELLSQCIRATTARQRFAAILVGVFSAVGLLLSAIGVYGVTAFNVAQRTAELGVRLALGAQPADLRRLVLRQAAMPIALGVIAGGAGALAAARFIQSQLYQTPARDPLVLIAIAVLLAAVALLACWLPARRAMRVNPIEALRAE